MEWLAVVLILGIILLAASEPPDSPPDLLSGERDEPADEPDACRNCRFFRRGECRVNPPEVGSSGEAKFPSVQPDDWCGAHEGDDDAAGDEID